MADFLSIRDLSKKDIERLLSLSSSMEKRIGKKGAGPLSGKIVSTMFFEPSTRTNMSFQAAAKRLGAHVLSFHPEKSSNVKGETFEDTVRMMDGYADALVIRHPQEGFAHKAAQIASHPVINAGDGGNQHPSQTLIDLYTIKKLKGTLTGLKVALMGDLRHARAMRSLLWGLSLYGNEISLVSPPSLRMEESIVQEAMGHGAKISISSAPDLRGLDVLYVCRVQAERFDDPSSAQGLLQSFRLDAKLLSSAPDSMAILHPLPKIDEVDPAVDGDPRAKYFEQAKNGVPVRMAVLLHCINGKQ